MNHFVISSSEPTGEAAALISRDTLAGRLDYLIHKLDEFRELEQGWYFGRGQQIEAGTIELAKSALIYGAYLGVWDANVFPGEDGAVRLSYEQSGFELDIRFGGDGSATWSLDKGGVQLDEAENLSVANVFQNISLAAREICPTFEPSILGNSTKYVIAGPARRSSRHRMVDFPCLNAIVPLPRQQMYASIYESITPALLGSPSSFGSSKIEIFHPTQWAIWNAMTTSPRLTHVTLT